MDLLAFSGFCSGWDGLAVLDEMEISLENITLGVRKQKKVVKFSLSWA
mgnify:CR=1 FL=1